ncbi:resuscitation-promoting factor [Aeromicrobium sp. REDSEA-S32_B7]|uniref:resuscitation-promoting factor n=1 Tax=Aeromicrobium sp. REDSEA-S32_B7 TaxID=1811526 RepID=UPI000ABFA7EC|nr:resuscitation-promoting factor [Aeromicrobium sp. REDSEA-S32_B7]
MHHPRQNTPQTTSQDSADATRRRHRQTTKRVVIALNLAVLLVLGAGVAAYGSLSKTVTLDVDGRKATVRTFGTSVGSLLKSHDVRTKDAAVDAEPTASVSDGDTIKVRYAKDVTVAVDGTVRRERLHAATVGDVLDELDVSPRKGAEVNAAKDTRLDDTASTVVVSNPKKLTVRADGRKRTVTSAAPTAGEVLEEAGVRLGAADEVRAGDALGEAALVKPGERVDVVRVRMVDTARTVRTAPQTEVREDDTLEKGTEKVLRAGAPRVVQQKVLVTRANGKVRSTLVLTQKVADEGSKRVVLRGTKEPEPEETTLAAAAPESAPAVGDDSVWDRIAQCESGGNWSINTGNGYYGGLQFSAATWHSVGGPGLPHENSREVQIKYAKILQQRSGWGQWSCAAKVGVH